MAEAAIEYYSSVSSSSSSTLSEKPQKRRRIGRKAAEQQQAREQQELEARQKHEAESRASALEYVQDFLADSDEWSDRMDFISIIYDAVPTMEELFSYGALDRSEGTRACRRLFKAVVIWDELGLGLYEKLHASEEAAAANTASVIEEVQEVVVDDGASTVVPRRASEDSGYSRLSFWAPLSRASSASDKQQKRKWYSRPASPSSSVDLSDALSATTSATSVESEGSFKAVKSSLPKVIRRTWAKLSEKSTAMHAAKNICVCAH